MIKNKLFQHLHDCRGCQNNRTDHPVITEAFFGAGTILDIFQGSGSYITINNDGIVMMMLMTLMMMTMLM